MGFFPTKDVMSLVHSSYEILLNRYCVPINSVPVTPVTVSYPQLPKEVTDCNQDRSVNLELPDRPVTPVTPQKSIVTNLENDNNHPNHCGVISNNQLTLTKRNSDLYL